MKFSVAITASILFFATALGGLIPSPSAGDVANHINMATDIAKDLSKQVGALTSSSSPSDIHGVAQNVATKLGSFSDGAKSYGAAAQRTPAFGDGDSQNIASAFNAYTSDWSVYGGKPVDVHRQACFHRQAGFEPTLKHVQFVPANQDLLNNLVSQYGLFQQADAHWPYCQRRAASPGLLSLSILASVPIPFAELFWSLEGVFKSELIPSQGKSVQGAQGALGGSLGKAIPTFQ